MNLSSSFSERKLGLGVRERERERWMQAFMGKENESFFIFFFILIGSN